jgi:hypothetical protein
MPQNGSVLAALLAYRSADYSFRYAVQQAAAQAAPLSARQEYLAWRATFLAADASFRERRRNAAFDKLIFKLSSITASGSPFNYKDQIDALLSQMWPDLANAYQRLMLVRNGMQTIFDVVMPELGALPDPSHTFPSSFLQSLTAWSRDCGQRLQQVTLNDQPYVHRVSLKVLIGDQKFATGRAAKSWTFEIPAPSLSGMRYIRLRGITAYANGEEAFPPTFIFDPPTTATYIYAGGKSAHAQQAVDRCRLGRTQSWPPNGAQPNIAGANILFNMSPVGTWQIHASSHTDLSGLNDVIVDFYTIYQQDRAN